MKLTIPSMKLPFPTKAKMLKLCFVTIVFSTFFTRPSLCGNNTNSTATNTYPPAAGIAACLEQNSVNNFTLFPNHRENNRTFSNFLDFSIQNLRFTLPSVPKPVAIAIPGSKEELTKTVLCCRKESLEIRVRSGGHSYEGTSSVAADGSPFAIIDLMNLNKISVDLESETAWIEGGATLGETYSAISEASRVHGFPAGSCPTVGVGGHISGGGFGLLSRKFGLAADNVVDALLIDASGKLLDRKSMGEDGFWVIRGGGGGNYGIIYAWKIKLVRVPEIVTGFDVTRPGKKQNVSRLVKKWQRIAPNLDDDFYLSLSLSASSPGIISAGVLGFYLGPKSEFMSALNKVFPELNIAPVDYKEMSWIESIYFFSGLPRNANKSINIPLLKDRHSLSKSFFKAKSDYVRNPITVAGITAAFDALAKEPNGYVILDPYGGFMEKISGDSIAFPHRKGNLFSIQYLVEWDEKDEEEMNGGRHVEWIRGFYESMRPYVSRNPRAAYVNYMDFDIGVMDPELQNDDPVAKARVWGEKYFLKNYDRLVKAKTIVDPLNVFRHQQGIFPMATAIPQSRSP